MKLAGGIVRGILEREDPHLHALLVRQWEIASNQWLAALSARQDSFHGFPHQRNVERYLDAVVADGEGAVPRLRVALSTSELYVLLSAVLFHDIGRAYPEQGPAYDHGEGSSAMLLRYWAELGLPSARMARAIGQVCSFHNLEKSKARHDRLRALRPEVVDPFGRIDVQALAALLFVADHVDGAYTRVLPAYFEPARGFAAIGTFRKAVGAVNVDHAAELVVTVLGPLEPAGADGAGAAGAAGPSADAKYECQLDPFSTSTTLESLREVWAADGRDNEWQSVSKLAHAVHAFPGVGAKSAPPLGRLVDELRAARPGVPPSLAHLAAAPSSLFEGYFAPPEGDRAGFSELEWLVLRKELRVRPAAAVADFKWDPSMVVAMVLGDVLVNDTAIRDVREVLSRLGLPIRAWLLEHEGRLYNAWGEQTYEPVFNPEYLKAVARAMWELNKHIFGWSRFTYENLADAVQDPDVSRVARAVQRLALALDSVTPVARPALSVRAAPDRWQLVTDDGDGQDLYSAGLGGDADPGLTRLLDTIGALGEPTRFD